MLLIPGARHGPAPPWSPPLRGAIASRTLVPTPMVRAAAGADHGPAASRDPSRPTETGNACTLVPTSPEPLSTQATTRDAQGPTPYRPHASPATTAPATSSDAMAAPLPRSTHVPSPTGHAVAP